MKILEYFNNLFGSKDMDEHSKSHLTFKDLEESVTFDDIGPPNVMDDDSEINLDVDTDLDNSQLSDSDDPGAEGGFSNK